MNVIMNQWPHVRIVVEPMSGGLAVNFQIMAVTQKDLHGWQFVLDGTKDTSRKPTRTRATTRDDIILKRDSDGLQIREGDTISINEDNSDDPQYGLVVSIQFAIDVFLSLQVLWFVRAADVEDGLIKGEVDPKELFLSSYIEQIKVQDVIDKIVVTGHTSKSKNPDLHCKRATTIDGKRISNVFNYTKALEKIRPDPKDLVDYLDQLLEKKQKTSPAKPAPSSSKPSPKKASKPVEKPKEDAESASSDNDKNDDSSQDEYDNETDDDDDDDDDAALKSDESEEDAEEDSDFEAPKPKSPRKQKASPKKTPRGSPRKTPKRSSRLSTPKKNQDASSDDDDGYSSPTPVRTPQKRGRKPNGETPTPKLFKRRHIRKAHLMESFDFMNSLLENKKALKLSELPRPSLKDLSPRKAKPVDLNEIDTKSSAFRQVKEKLHHSMRLTSLPCREDEFTALFMNLESAIREEVGCCLYVSGTPGIGKTATVREVIAQLKEMRQTNDINDFDFVEINGLKLISPASAYEYLWEQISGFEVAPSNAAMLLETYFKEEDINKKPLVVLLDELDQIATKRQNVMYNFLNWPTYNNSKLIVIAVANTMDLPERILTNKISSRLGLRRIQFIGYTFQQLGAIIEHRLDMITRQNKNHVEISPDAISFASRKVASVSGDARRALTICRRAVEIAEEDFRSQEKDKDDKDEDKDKNKEAQEDNDQKVFQVQISHISKAINETINSPIVQYLSSLSFISKLVLAALLLRVRRTSKADQSLGDVVDEMKHLVTMKTSGNVFDSSHNPTEFFYGSKDNQNIRPHDFRYQIYELSENGIITQQYIKTERYRIITLDVSEEEVLAALKKDKDFDSLI